MTNSNSNEGRSKSSGRGRRVRNGVDVQSISSFRQFDPAVASRVKQRVFTETERAYCEGTRYPAQHYAVRWAAKEAFIKLVGGLDGFAYNSVGVVSGSSGPWLDLDNSASKVLQQTFNEDLESISRDLSLSHDRDGDIAIAQIVAQGGATYP